jgi:hypothetical protein
MKLLLSILPLFLMQVANVVGNRLELYKAGAFNSNNRIKTLTDGSEVPMNGSTIVFIPASMNGNTNVQFYVHNSINNLGQNFTEIEIAYPYAIRGDSNGILNAWTPPQNQLFYVTAISTHRNVQTRVTVLLCTGSACPRLELYKAGAFNRNNRIKILTGGSEIPMNGSTIVFMPAIINSHTYVQFYVHNSIDILGEKWQKIEYAYPYAIGGKNKVNLNAWTPPQNQVFYVTAISTHRNVQTRVTVLLCTGSACARLQSRATPMNRFS